MTFELITAFAGFCLVSSITPGPNNLMLMASGANFGFTKSIPHMLGIGIGFVLMVFLVGFGLAQIFNLYPIAHTILKVVSVVYLLYLAWKVANASPVNASDPNGSPMTFLQAAAFQWVNPKAWTMALTAVTVYAPNTEIMTIFLLSAIFGVVNLPSISLWTTLGQQMARILTNPMRLRVFNWVMACLLVASLYPVLWP